MNRQMELESLAQIKALFNDDAAMEKMAEYVQSVISEDLVFKVSSASWDAIGLLPVSQNGKKLKMQTPAESNDLTAYLVAAQRRCLEICCPHVAFDQPHAMRVLMAARTTTCDRCVHRFTKNGKFKPRYEDECDLCLSHGVKEFQPFNFAWYGILFHGEACPDCTVLLKRYAT